MPGSSAEFEVPRGETRSDADAVRGDSTVDLPPRPTRSGRVPKDQGSTVDLVENVKASVPSGKRTTKDGSVYGDFRIDSFIGEGSMGEVYLATQLSLKRTVALKILPSEYNENSHLVERFQRETRSMSELDHPNIVKVFATGVQDDRHYAALEYIDGSSLQDCLERHVEFEVGDAIHITLVCAHALQHAHDKGIVHRDIKPANVLLTSHGMSKIADFGLVKIVEQTDMGMTGSGTGLGTPEYMPPEQAFDARSADPRSDIYSLGIMFYVMLTRELPFKGRNSIEYLTLKQRGTYKRAREVNPNVPEKVDLILQKMLQAEPNHRYPSCSELIRDLGLLKRHNNTLSFIELEESERFVAYGPWSSEKPMTSVISAESATKSSQSKMPTPSGSSDSADRLWYVAHKNKLGKSVLSKMMTDELIKALKNKLLPISAQVKSSPKERFRTLADYDVFHPVLEQLGVKVVKKPAAATGTAPKAKAPASGGQKRRPKKKSEGLDLFIKVATGIAATYGIIRGAIDLYGLFR